MATAPRFWSSNLLHFWFQRLGPVEWFNRNDATDADIARRFGGLWKSLRHCAASDFLDNPLTACAAVLLFDQVPRNIFRGDPRSFASDALAREIARAAIARGWAARLSRPARQFLYMPFMHSEAVADQIRSVALFAGLDDANVFAFARAHYRTVARFGRFPHRNEVLGRQSTFAENRAVAAGAHW